MFDQAINIRTYIVFTALILFGFTSLSHAQPKIVFEEEVYDFGEVMQGENVEHTFIFRNDGSEELVIDKVTPS